MSETSVQRRKELVQRLEEGFAQVRDSDRFRTYLDTCAKFHKYSIRNTMLIWMQRPDASKVAGFHTWLNMGRAVKKGEKGIQILAPLPYRKVEETEDGEEATIETVYFRPVHVFDVSQTEGDDLPAIANDLDGDDAGLFSKLDAIAQQEGLSVDRAPGRGNGANGFYSSQRNLIWLKPESSPLMATKTLAHELAHHFAGHQMNGQCRDEQETVAESAAYIVLGHYGIDAGSYSFDYLAAWTDAKVFKGKL
ncbi:hypothetical protein LCGC14_0286120, partial [marine sediment metagenome]